MNKALRAFSMAYTEAQAKRLAKQIFDLFDKQIYEATLGTFVPPSFVAGLVGNEAGKDRHGNIVRSATRFEPHVFAALKAVRDGHRAAYNRITRADIADASNDALRALAHSYEATQIMGWHVIKNLHCTIADLRNPEKHFFYTVKLLLSNEDNDISTKTEAGYERAMREWNTGKENGKTYHADYSENAAAVRRAYRELEKNRVTRSVVDRVNVSIEEIEEASIPETAELRQDPQEIQSETSQLGEPSVKQAVAPQAEAPTQQVAENILNVGTESPVPPNFVPEEKTADAPPPTGFFAKLKFHVASLGIGTGTLAALKGFTGVQLGAETVDLLKIVVPTILGLGFLGFLAWYISEKVVGFKTLKLQSEINTDPNRHNLTIKPQ
jgi:hypothetical protein